MISLDIPPWQKLVLKNYLCLSLFQENNQIHTFLTLVPRLGRRVELLSKQVCGQVARRRSWSLSLDWFVVGKVKFYRVTPKSTENNDFPSELSIQGYFLILKVNFRLSSKGGDPGWMCL